MTATLHPSESRIQQEIYNWYWNAYCRPCCSPRCIIWHVPNQNQQCLVPIGVLPGVADLTIFHQGKFIQMEVKEPGKGKQKPAQSVFEAHCKQSGIPYYIVYSLDEAKEVIRRIDAVMAL